MRTTNNQLDAYQLPATSDGVTCYENNVPAFLEEELDRLYGNIFSSFAQFRNGGSISDDTSAYVARERGSIVAIFLFRREKNRIRVINEGITADDEQVARFADYIFAIDPAVSVILFHAVQTGSGKFSYPSQRFNCLEDIVLTLPGTSNEYLGILGKSTQSYVKRYLNKLRREHPTFQYKAYEKYEADEQHLRAIVGLNHARMVSKKRVSVIDETEMQKIIGRVRECGLVTVATINDKVCAGVITYRCGMNYFLDVISHDQQYNEYRLGTLCCYLAIQECIARGSKEFHFLWGQYEYKYRLGGIQRNLDDLLLYRSKANLLLQAPLVLKISTRGYIRQLKLWVHQQQKRGKSLLKNVTRFFHELRNVKSGTTQ